MVTIKSVMASIIFFLCMGCLMASSFSMVAEEAFASLPLVGVCVGGACAVGEEGGLFEDSHARAAGT